MARNLLVICGPTATGKTSLGIKLARILDGEIISADSRQVYKGMDIVTGKDFPVTISKIKNPCLNGRSPKRRQKSKIQSRLEKELNGDVRIVAYDFGGIPVWGLDLVRPDQEFSVAHFVELASRVIEDIWRREKLPIIVGGTGLYIQSLFVPIETVGIAPDWQERGRMASWSVSRLEEKLKKLDPNRFARMNQSDQYNPRRLIRAIEVASQNQKPIHQLADKNQKHFSTIKNCLIIGLKTVDLRRLHERIDKRIKARVEQGAEKEVRALFAQYSLDNSVLATTIGYKQWQAYLQGEISREEAIKRWQLAEHAYARRQMTWFKKQPGIRWFEVDDRRFPQNVVKAVKEWYSKKEVSTTEIYG
jgi:tRNA dimethylallyltransferase